MIWIEKGLVGSEDYEHKAVTFELPLGVQKNTEVGDCSKMYRFLGGKASVSYVLILLQYLVLCSYCLSRDS